MQLQFTAMRCYAPAPAGGAKSAPQTSWLDFRERKKGKKEGKGKGGKRKGEGGKGKGNKREKEKGTKEREGGERKREMKEERKGKGRNLCSCDFPLLCSVYFTSYLLAV